MLDAVFAVRPTHPAGEERGGARMTTSPGTQQDSTPGPDGGGAGAERAAADRTDGPGPAADGRRAPRGEDATGDTGS